MLYYDTKFELQSSSGLLQVWFFRANDVFDPDASGTGHQPIGFDQAMLFWEQWCVFSSKITVNFMNNANNCSKVGIFMSPDTAVPSSNADLMENGLLVHDLVFGTSTTTAGGAYHTIAQCSLTCDNVRYFSSKNKETYFANPNFTGTAGGSCAEGNYFGVFMFGFNNNNATDVFFDVSLSYDVRFWEPRKIATSLLHEAVQSLVFDEGKDEKKTRDKPVSRSSTGSKAAKRPP